MRPPNYLVYKSNIRENMLSDLTNFTTKKTHTIGDIFNKISIHYPKILILYPNGWLPGHYKTNLTGPPNYPKRAGGGANFFENLAIVPYQKWTSFTNP